MRQRDKNGRFVSDQVNLTNDFKGLEINQDKPIKQFPYVQSVVGIIIVFAIILLAHYLGWIEVTKNGGF